ncbi:E3 ubiquitin-protein ligase SHPRH isoform X2 [Drosophila innubila]|uniref:E3 ubiquitin-protein ligase SHPRH isoform X2 n=1 Tax=Drosophila innubila TaxID=198719 RepID=UPI00148D8640|nr:E3 ubiquitin-protein ligase SHPRH isoform X2 [Drosophila innubila]
MPRISLPPGGILADEMGLGKTVELLATLLLNPNLNIDNTYWRNSLEQLSDVVPLKKRRRQHKVHCICVQQLNAAKKVQCLRCQLWQHQNCMQDSYEYYICPNCWTELTVETEQLVNTGATIIISPNEIKTQWQHEVGKHVNDTLKVLLYPGLHSGSWYSPLELAKYDIVLTDYTILMHELNHTPRNTTDRELRYEQRYMRPSSPLLMVKWWRVCLDEAQMVESSTSKAAEMVSNLPAVHRWAVTGTPIQKTIDDLAPLLKFIGFRAACEPLDAWQTVANSFLLNHKVEPLLELLQHCMWRTCKSKVEQELGIPPQSEVVHYLDLSNVESLYYREEHFKCTSLFLDAIAKHSKYNPNTSSSCLSSISPQLLRIMLQPFLRIRKTCSIPVVVNKNVSDTNTYMNRQELLVHLKATNEKECKQELRTWASSYNGIAAINFIQSQYKDAINNYKQVIKLANDYNDEHISVDSLLQIHALHNMLKASKLAPKKDELPDEELSTYSRKLNKLQRKYLETTTPVMKAAEMAYESKLEELDKLAEEFDSSIVELLATLINTGECWHKAVWNRITHEFFRLSISTEKLAEVTSMTGVVYLLHTWHDRLRELRKKLRHDFEILKQMVSQACGTMEKGLPLTIDSIKFIKSVSNCHLAEIMDDKPTNVATNQGKPPKKRLCHLCKIRESVNQFECLIFAKELGKEGTITDGSENPSWEITLIKVVLGFLSAKSEFHEWKKECTNKLEQLDCLQSLGKSQIKYWIEVEYVIKSFDELDMCKMRISLTEDPEEQSNYRLLPEQLEEQRLFNTSNIEESQLNFIRLMGRLKYLKHLKEDTGDKPCPICQTLDDDM